MQIRELVTEGPRKVRKEFREYPELWFLVALVILIAFIVFAVGAGDFPDRFAERCTEANGEILSDTKTSGGAHPVINPDGSMGIGFSAQSTTIRLCQRDGKILEMEVK